MNDDDLEARLSNARPPTPRRGDPIGPRQEAVLRRNLAGDSPRLADARTSTGRTASHKPMWLAAASVVIVLIVAALSAVALLHPVPAVAATPPPLEARRVDGTAEENLLKLSDEVRSSGIAPSDAIRTQSWSLSFHPESDELPSVVQPEQQVIQHLPNGDVSIEVRSGTAYDRNGRRVQAPETAPGTLLWRDTVPAADYVMFFGDPPTDVSAYAAFLTEAEATDGMTSGDYFSATANLMSERSLTREQASALIAFLATLPGIVVDGAVTDRLGREGVAFSTTSRQGGDYRDTLVVSGSDGFLSYEVTYIGSSRTDIQAPAVIEYIAWE